MPQELSEPGIFQAKWYAVHIKSNQERVCASFLANRQLDVFLPTYRIRSRRVDRRVMLTKPLFPGYLFVNIDAESRQKRDVLKAPGVVKVVGFGDTPTPIPDETIRSVRILVGSAEGMVKPHPLVRAGQRVVVVMGPFCGASGVIHIGRGRKPRLVVEVEFLGRAVAVPIVEDQVKPVPS